MCELLAINFNHLVNPSFSFRGFRKRGEYNKHGWGLAFYSNNSSKVIKEPSSAVNSERSYSIQQNDLLILSKIIISHVRRTSGAKQSYNNTHPFQKGLNGKDYVFAHNGTIRDYENDFDTFNFKPEGETDSEALFCHLLNQIKEEKIDFNDQSSFNWLLNKLQYINKEYGKLNCLLSDGEYLFAYCDYENKGGLTFLRRKYPFGSVTLKDDDFCINLNKEKNPSQRGFIIATKPLTDENWKSFQPGELMVLKNGEIIYQKS